MPEINPKLLRINLTAREITTETIDPKITDAFIGGRGYAITYLYRELTPGVDPFKDQNKLLLVSGVLGGTSAQAVSRWMVYTKSPLTGALGRSVCGADFGAWMKFAGYDVIIVEGKADKPVYVHVTPEASTVEDAADLWGKDTAAVQEWITGKHGKQTRTACIGPGGEKRVRYAAIVSGRRTAGRCGTGAVMGSKNLKAVAITAKRNLSLYDPDTFKDLVKKQVKMLQENQAYEYHKEMGTTSTQDLTNYLGIFPVRNFQYGQMLENKKIHGDAYKKFRVGKDGCYSCAARCGMIHHVPGGPYEGAKSEGPEYESIWSFGGSIDSTYIQSAIAADQICDDLGIDTISAGVTIGFAYELYEKGLLTKEDADGLELTWGNHEAMVTLVRKIGEREGFGDLLAEGTKRMAEKIGNGAEKYAIHVKGLELPAYEPRGAKSQGFNYVTSNIGASHCYGYAGQEIFGRPVPRAVDRFAEAENADIVIFNQNAQALREVGVVCSFAAAWGWMPDLYGPMLAAATGMEECKDDAFLQSVGDRIMNMERQFIVREGFSRKDDTLPQRMTQEPLDTRGVPGHGEIVRDLDGFLDRYYDLRGWTRDGVPTQDKLKALGLEGFILSYTPHSAIE
ncbi:MAG: aldehyde ferredoxin oxidoreductase family protein [Desulfobacterales bacterium]